METTSQRHSKGTNVESPGGYDTILVLFVGLLVVLTGCERPGCKRDDHCKGERICVEEQCVDPPAEDEETTGSATDDKASPEGQGDAQSADSAQQGTKKPKQPQKPAPTEQVTKDLQQLLAGLENAEDCEERYMLGYRETVLKDIAPLDESAVDVDALDEVLSRSSADLEALDTQDCPAGSFAFGMYSMRILDQEEWQDAASSWQQLLISRYGRLPGGADSSEELAPEARLTAREKLLDRGEKKEVEVGTTTVKVTRVKQRRTWPFDRHGRRWMEREADKNAEYVYLDLEITSKEENPKLPPLVAWKLNDSEVELLGVLETRFYRWSDYGTYLGNTHDMRNDFAKRDTVKFTAGISVDEEVLENSPVMIGVYGEQCMERTYDRFSNPPLAYNQVDCFMGIPNTVNALWLLGNVTPVHWVNRKVLKKQLQRGEEGGEE